MAGTLNVLEVSALRDGRGVLPIYAAPLYNDARALSAGAAEAHTVPTGAKAVFITPASDAWVNFAATAAVPAADVTDGSAAVYLPAGKQAGFNVANVTTISLISAGNQVVSLTFYA